MKLFWELYDGNGGIGLIAPMVWTYFINHSLIYIYTWYKPTLLTTLPYIYDV